MFKVVIADDEVRVCRLVQMLADWDALGMEVAATASNGFEALELVERLKPDILITDIRMPGCDGLKLIEKARKLSPRLEIIIISGYAQFEYAQTAIRFGVGGYLLKPIKKDALMATLEKLAEILREREAGDTVLESLRRDSRKSHALLRGRLIEDLVTGTLYAPTRDMLREAYGFVLGDGQLQVFILKMDYDPDRFSASSLAIVQKKVEELFAQTVLPLCLIGLMQFQRSAGYGVLHFESGEREALRRALRSCLNQLEAQKFFFGSVEFSLAVGPVIEHAEELPLSLRGAQNALCERLLEGTGRLLEHAPAASEAGIRQLLSKYSRVMEPAVDALLIGEADKAVDALAEAVAQTPGMRGFELVELMLSAGRMFLVRACVEEEAQALKEFEERLALCANADKLFACLRALQRQTLEETAKAQQSEAIRPIRIAKQYIQQHYSEPITLEDVCAATGFSVSYFSTMFKKETGEGFAKYLTRVRIDQAKALLQETNLSVSEVCDRVGYSDIKHFTSIFKKITSLNPGQYRKLYG